MNEVKLSQREFRFIITQQCNYQCLFCHEEGLQGVKTRDKLTPEDYAFAFKTARDAHGWNTTTLTGGEPLARRDVVEIAKALYIQGARTTITSNGVLLINRMDIGRFIERLNISVHSTNPRKYDEIVGRTGMYDKMIEGLRLYRSKYPKAPIKLNATVSKGLNSEPTEVHHLIDLEPIRIIRPVDRR